MLGDNMEIQDSDEIENVECEMSYKRYENMVFVTSVVCMALLTIAMIFFLTGCTLSFQNISTHGQATDLVDEEQTTDPVVSPTTSLQLPLQAL